jgi:hypothetical protein
MKRQVAESTISNFASFWLCVFMLSVVAPCLISQWKGKLPKEYYSHFCLYSAVCHSVECCGTLLNKSMKKQVSKRMRPPSLFCLYSAVCRSAQCCGALFNKSMKRQVAKRIIIHHFASIELYAILLSVVAPCLIVDEKASCHKYIFSPFCLYSAACHSAQCCSTLFNKLMKRQVAKSTIIYNFGTIRLCVILLGLWCLV